VIAAGNMLVLADEAMGERIGAQVGDEQVVHRADPFDALVELSSRRWPAVVLSAPRADFAGLCRAARRLQEDATLLAVCPPPAEPEVHPLLGGPLDDYFIYPLTRSDVAQLRGAAAGTGTVRGAVDAEAPPAGAPGLAPPQLAKLITAARAVSSLETCLADLVAERLGAPVRWADADGAAGDARLLLLADETTSRVLVLSGASGRPDASSEAFLVAIQQYTPALLATARRTSRLHRLAITDHLTGAYNRRYFYQLTHQILLQARQRKFRVTLLLYDIDDFKRYNDTYGHAAGDDVLRETARLMRQVTRARDIVARIGGDEFCVLFWDAEGPRTPGSTPPNDVYELADRFRQAVQAHEFSSLGPEARGTLTISGGLASFPGDGQTCRELLRKADEALRIAKASGKNAIHLVGTE